MKEQLEQYVNLLFAGADNCEDIKQEILQNTLDRYDDLIAQGKVPEAAYRLAIAGIGDVNEILGFSPRTTPEKRNTPSPEQTDDGDTPAKKRIRAIAIGMYIICAIPLILLCELGLEILGVCITLTIVAVATVMLILAAKKDDDDEEKEEQQKEALMTPRQKLSKSIRELIGTVTLVLYFAISFITHAWHITWLIFPISGAVKELVKAILDLKEAKDYEN